MSRQIIGSDKSLVTEQLSLLAVEGFLMSCSISWMASLIDNLYILDLLVLVIN
jgi:hypothetical protein